MNGPIVNAPRSPKIYLIGTLPSGMGFVAKPAEHADLLLRELAFELAHGRFSSEEARRHEHLDRERLGHKLVHDRSSSCAAANASVWTSVPTAESSMGGWDRVGGSAADEWE